MTMPHFLTGLLTVSVAFAAPQTTCNITAVSYDFFTACESGWGWNGTHAYVASEKTPFKAQITDALPGPKLSAVHTVKDYAEWMVGVVKEFGPKATFEVKAYASYGTGSLFYAVFGGVSDYVYSLTVDPTTCKISAMTKIWNDGYASKHPPKSGD